MYKKRQTINSLYNNLKISKLNKLFLKYNFFIVYDTLTYQNNFLQNNPTGNVKTQLLVKVMMKMFYFSFIFRNKNIKYPLYVQFIEDISFFENFILYLYSKILMCRYLKYRHFVFSSMSQNSIFNILFSKFEKLSIYSAVLIDSAILL